MSKYYETLKKLNETIEDKAELVISLSEKQSISLEESLDDVNDYLEGIKLSKEFERLCGDLPAITDVNEYGIPMIKSDKEW